MSSVERRAAAVRSPARRLTLPALAGAGVVAIALGVTFCARAAGAYDVRAWGPLGLGLVAALAFASSYGLRTSRSVGAAAAALVALGLWAVASTAWGGLPQQAWSALDRSLIAAAALVLGAALAAGGRRALVPAAVLAGVTAQSVEILVRATAGRAPEAWFHGRMLEGPVGYHNAQGLLCAVALPLALWGACGARPLRRAVAGLAAAPLTAVLLLTQSRGALAAAGVGVACQVVLSRRLRVLASAIALVAGGCVWALALRAVDRALLTEGPAGSTGDLRTYALVTAAVGCVLAAAAALPAPRRAFRIRPVAFAVVAAALAAATIGAALLIPRLAPRVHAVTATLLSDAPPASAPGTTRFAAVTLDGRREAWRVAMNAIRASPVTGDGAGRYAVRWGAERRLPELYVLQPHSLELELGSELGAPGVALFAAFAGAALLGLRAGLRAHRMTAAAGAASLAALLVESSVDWTWSFPGIVAPVLLLVGATAAPARSTSKPRPQPVVLVAAVAALVALAFPYVAANELARAAGSPSPALALVDVQAAVRLDPWDADAVSVEGRLLEQRGEFVAAAERYGRAAELSQRPWVEWFRQARALRRAHADVAAAVACLLAWHADPGEDLLHNDPCGWPWVAIHVPGARPPGGDGATRR